MKHVELRLLILPDWQREGRASLRKVNTYGNTVDFLTKYTSQTAFEMGCRQTGLQKTIGKL